MSFRSSNVIEDFPPSQDPENSHLNPDKAKELDKRARQINKALGWAAANGVQEELLQYVAGEVERLQEKWTGSIIDAQRAAIADNK